MMLVPEPELLIADEPTSALDVTVQAQLLELIDELIQRRGMALLLISHNLNLVASFCDRVMVMYAGQVMETCRASELGRARHPYTRGLLACRPVIDEAREELATLQRDPTMAHGYATPPLCWRLSPRPSSAPSRVMQSRAPAPSSSRRGPSARSSVRRK